MEITKKENGQVQILEPAFPFVTISQKQNFAGQIEMTQTAVTGMSLRDYFAAQALQVAMQSGAFELEETTEIVTWSFSIADEMLSQRKK